MKEITQRALDDLGRGNVARYFGISYEAVRQWDARGKVPAERVLGIEHLSDRRYTRHVLRPDIFGGEREPKAI